MRHAVIHKPIGQTPLEALTAFKREHAIPESLPSCYAGRLDPMASGKLLVLFGDECKRLARYTGLDKEYVVEVLVGVGSDTGDVLGIPTYGSPSQGDIKEALRNELGTHERPYPVFSSKTVAGKPLFMYALQGTLNLITIPTHKETVYAIQHVGTQKVSNEELRVRVMELLSLSPTSDEPSKALGADFRIGSIKPEWERILNESREYEIHTLKVSCASGTYMRTLAGRLGEALGTRALALSITRTKIGKYLSALRLWIKEY